MSAHAFLSPSAAHRWLTCTPSARFEEQYPESTSEFAEEGTLAHELCERMLKNLSYDDLKDNPLYTEEMRAFAEDYKSVVYEMLNEAKKKTKDAQLFVEVKLDISSYVQECFGTSDAVIISDGTMQIIDFKFGKGVPVSAVENNQLMLYALGAYDKFDFLFGVDKIILTIIQPRLSNNSSYEISAEKLLEWGQNVVRPAGVKAWLGKGNFNPGEHCRFCKGKAECSALAEANLKIVETFSNQELNKLAKKDIAYILTQKDQIINWLNAVDEGALNSALAGEDIPGFKLVAGRSNRKYTDTNKVANVLLNNGYKDSEIYKKSLLGITDMEKVLTKKVFATLLEGLVEKPLGAPTLVENSDPRPVYNSAENDFKDIDINI